MIEIAPMTKSRFIYNDAVLYCFALNIDGKIGWRLPTAEELYQIYKTTTEPNYDIDHMILVWSSTAADNPLHPHLYQNAIRMTSRYRLAYHEAVWELCKDGRGSAWIIPVRDLP
jgi:hypothetical protein